MKHIAIQKEEMHELFDMSKPLAPVMTHQPLFRV